MADDERDLISGTNALELDWAGLQVERVGPRFGITPDERATLAPCICALHEQIQQERVDAAAGRSRLLRDSPDEPLDYGFMDMPARLLGVESALSQRIQDLADQLAEEADAHVVLGIGGSYQGAQALFDALLPTYFNELPRQERGNRPRIYFEGNNVDGLALHDLRQLLDVRYHRYGATPAGRFSLNVISKSGRTLETEVAFSVLRERLRAQGLQDYSRRLVVTTGAEGPLAQAAREDAVPTLPVPDNVGGRYSVLTAVGLLPAAVMGLNIRQLLQGAADFQAYCDAHPDPTDNPAWLYAALHVRAYERGATTRVLAVWTRRLEALGRWYDQLLAESLGKGERGATPLTIVATRELHSRQQQHQQGARDKVITNLLVRDPGRDVTVEGLSFDPRRAPEVVGRRLSELATLAVEATNAALNEDHRPTMNLCLPRLDEYHFGQLVQMLMNATVMEGKLLGIWPFGQPGVEAYKRRWDELLRSRPAA
ncbi:MAG: glucose-6-phosphate isomerase [Armatimonadetes bacterium]|nr:glucose-6-phosphate isomerase [Armatimonadota bacterium]